jgi:pSer/pThr/pTyr-binding forkhead associated (FHA) protein
MVENEVTMHAELIPLEGGTAIRITRDVTLVGRSEELCDVVINRNSISKLQCLIVRSDGLLFVRDLASTNGTRVNGQRVTRGALLPGDELAFASLKFRVNLGPARPEADHNEVTEMITMLPGSDKKIDREDLDNSSSEVRLFSDE